MAFGRAALLSMLGVTLSKLPSVEATMTFIKYTSYTDTACTSGAEVGYIPDGICVPGDDGSTKMHIASGQCNVARYSSTDCSGTASLNLGVALDSCHASDTTASKYESYTATRYATMVSYSGANCTGTAMEVSIPLISEALSGKSASFDSSANAVTIGTETRDLGVCIASTDGSSGIVTTVGWDGSTYTGSGLASWAAQLSPSFLTTSAAALLSSLVATAL